MNTPMETKSGRLSVTVESESNHLRYDAPIEIRDSKMRPVGQSEDGRNFDLHPGFYQVSAVLEDGRKHTRMVEVKQDERANIELRAPEEREYEVDLDATVKEEKLDLSQMRRFERPRFTQKIDSIRVTDEGGSSAAELLDVAGASILQQSHNTWVFGSEENGSAVATATLRLGSRKTVISLPTSQPNDLGPVTCAVRIDESATGPRATAWISPERVVANAFMNMLASGQLRHAADMADGAVELFRQKYNDPTGATLGALILHKVDRLENYMEWIENIVRDFGWIPDCKILLASIFVKKRKHLDRAWELAQEASQQRMLYAESYSILLDLLRRWPRENRSPSHEGAVAELARHSPHIDWDSICLSHTEEG